MPPPDIGLDRTYREAVYEMDLTSGPIRFRIGDRLDTDPFALVTAFNPGHEHPGEEPNLNANHRLEAAIREGGWRSLPARGMSPDGAHVEPSFAIFDIALGQALSLAAEFRQAAIVWFDGSTATLAWTSEHTAPTAT